MGNTQSSIAAAPKKSTTHKLSKPRIGNHAATAGLLSANGSSTGNVRFSDARLSDKALPHEPVLSPASPLSATSVTFLDVPADPAELPDTDKMVSNPVVQRKESRRKSIFRSLSYQRTTTSKSVKRASSVGPSPKPPAAADKLDRANSMTTEITHTEITHIAYYAGPTENWSSRSSMGSRRTSWNYDMSSYEAKRLLNLVEEPTFEQTAAMSDRLTAVSVVSEATWKSSNPININLPQASNTPISRANSDLSLYTPVRRRSIIQTPGVATRTRTMPAPSKSNFRHSVPATPTMSRQQSFESMRSGVISMPPRILDLDSIPRVVTPSELEYQSIGAFKLGSLRITNGAASPNTPELERESEAVAPNSSVTRGRTDYFFGAPVPPVPGQGETVEAVDDKTRTIASPQPRTRNLSPIAASFLEIESHQNTSDVVVQDLSTRHGVTEIPQGFLAEISFTPFTLEDSRPLSPELQTTSKHTAIEDDLFADDGTYEYSTVEVLDVRLDLNAKSQLDSQQDTKLTLRTVSRTDSGFVSAGSPSSEAPLKSLTKADSGYSSNVSLRSFTTSKSHAADGGFTQTSLSRSTSGPSDAGEQLPHTPVRVTLERPAQPSREPPPPPVPPKDAVPASPTRASGASAFNKALMGLREARLSTPTSSVKSRHTPSPINSMRSAETGPISPDSMLHTPKSARSDVSTSALSIGSGSNRPNKLQRLLSGARRMSHGPPMVHATHALDKSVIPSIPQEVEIKLHEHTGLFPITTKRLALKPQQSKDTLKTIFSVGSMEMSLDAMNPIRSSSPVLTDEETAEMEESHGRHLVSSMQSSIAHATAHIIPRKSIARRPGSAQPTSPIQMIVNAAREAEHILPVEADLTSYSSISSSLGDNPYDAAVMAMGHNIQKKKGQQNKGMLSPLAMTGRTMSMTTSADRNSYASIRKSASASSLVDAGGIALPSPLLPREPLAIQPKKTKTPPPVSMMNRPNGTLRVPRSLRRHKSAQSLSRKSSRESIHSYPPATPADGPSLSRRSSRDNVQSYPPYQQAPPSRGQGPPPPPIPQLDPRRRSMSLRNQNHPQGIAPGYRAPNWDPQRQNSLSRRSSISSMDSSSRNNSFSSARSTQGYQLHRPSSNQTHQARPDQPLRHRASYDGYFNPTPRGQPPSMSNGYSNPTPRGHPPSMSNGYTAPTPPKPVIDPRWNNNRQPAPPKMDQYGVYPPHVPRGHDRNRSVGNHGYPSDAPYRVLHSYNSPAYRNVPIWG